MQTTARRGPSAVSTMRGNNNGTYLHYNDAVRRTANKKCSLETRFGRISAIIHNYCNLQ